MLLLQTMLFEDASGPEIGDLAIGVEGNEARALLALPFSFVERWVKSYAASRKGHRELASLQARQS
jgi:hypothetical protein